MTLVRDPVSRMFDPVARRALGRCWASPGRWVPVRLPRLSVRLFITWLARGEDLRAADPWDDQLDRYVRAFIRSAYYTHRWHGGFDGFRREKRTAPWDGLVLCYRAEKQAGQWRVRLIAAPKGDRRLPARRAAFTSPEQADPPVGGF